MYAGLWRALPGPIGVRIVLLLLLIAAVLAALVFWVFPWVDTFVTPQDVTVDQGMSAVATRATIAEEAL